MKNLFCISKHKLIVWLWGDKTHEHLIKIIDKFKNTYSLDEMLQQCKQKAGEVWQFFEKEIKTFTNRNTNNEASDSIELASLYFPGQDPHICFEIKKGVAVESIVSYNKLIENIEDSTQVDCLIKNTEKEFYFQLKRYPEQFKTWSVRQVSEYLQKEILSQAKYNSEENKDLIVIIKIEPKQDSDFKEVEDFNAIHNFLKTQEIKIKEINFLYNRNNINIVWYQVFPCNGHYEIPVTDYWSLVKNEDVKFHIPPSCRNTE